MDVLPVAAVAMAARLLAPSVSAVLAVTEKVPFDPAVAVPMAVAPSKRMMVLPLLAVPVRWAWPRW